MIVTLQGCKLNRISCDGAHSPQIYWHTPKTQRHYTQCSNNTPGVNSLKTLAHWLSNTTPLQYFGCPDSEIGTVINQNTHKLYKTLQCVYKQKPHALLVYATANNNESILAFGFSRKNAYLQLVSVVKVKTQRMSYKIEHRNNIQHLELHSIQCVCVFFFK